MFLNFMNGNCSKNYFNQCRRRCFEFQDRLGCTSSVDACKIDVDEEKEFSVYGTAHKNTNEVRLVAKMGLKKLF